MSIKRKLITWQNEGLITVSQGDAILAYESENHSSIFKNALIYIAVFSILLGLSLITAANWQAIPAPLKLGSHFALNIILGVLIYIWRDNPTRKTPSQIALFFLWGLTLTLIALIGQTFQLSGNAWDATRFWFIITTPMMLFLAQGRFLTVLWGLFFVLYVPFDICINIIDNMTNETKQSVSIVALATLLPLILYAASPYLRPNMNTTFKNLSWLLALGSASLTSVLFYDQINTQQTAYIILPMVIIIVACLALMRTKTPDKSFADIFILSTFFISAPFILPITLSTSPALISLLHMLILWLGAGYIFQRSGHYKMLNLAIIIITVRLFIGFLELFGSMMLSGFGFILMGLVLIALLFAARRIKQVLTS